MIIQTLIQRAIDSDVNGSYFEAQDLYSQVTNMIEKITSNDLQANLELSKCYDEYKRRALTMKVELISQMRAAKLVDYAKWEKDSVNITYESAFGCCFSVHVKELIIDEAWTQTNTELEHLVEFIETVIYNCPNLKFILLRTQQAPAESDEQAIVLNNLIQDVGDRNQSMSVEFVSTMLTSRILFNSGCLVESKRGLHFYDDANLVKNSVGSYNYAYRKCKDNELNFYLCDDLRMPL